MRKKDGDWEEATGITILGIPPVLAGLVYLAQL